MRNWDTRDESGPDKGCEWEKDWEDLQRVCKVLDIPVTMVDVSKDYWNNVFGLSLRLWEQGPTPSWDVWCNSLAPYSNDYLAQTSYQPTRPHPCFTTLIAVF